MQRILTPLAAILPLMFATTATLAAEDAPKPYPLKTCIVSGEKLGEMGDPYVFTKDGQEIKLCCTNCLKDFNKDPDKYLKKLQKKGAAPAESGHEQHSH